jgi:hypothetical protein
MWSITRLALDGIRTSDEWELSPGLMWSDAGKRPAHYDGE